MVNDQTAVWKALADPTRRQILDFLRISPLTVGEISKKFEISRIGVMKHLTTLKKANLVVDKKKGREHWYKLNVIPLEEIYNRWMRPYEKLWASSLISLKNNIEKGEKSMEMKLLEIKQNIEIRAKPTVVYTALVNNISDWWGRPYIINEQSNKLTLEAKVGGLFYESWGDNQGFKWGEVTYLKNNEILEITGSFGMTKAIFGRVRFTLSEKENGTNIELSHRAYGDITEETEKGYTTGWRDLIGLRLKIFVEEGVRMGLGNEPSMDEVMKRIANQQKK
jgi:DNA-binding transcriptional ArsR family regulator/uncharacterized protein YndB with AHSA1/START domain